MGLPQSNATVTRIVGSAEKPVDWELAGTPGGAKWTGQAQGYYRAARERVAENGTVTYVLRHSLIVERELADELDQDDSIEFTYRGEALTAKVRLKPDIELADADPVRSIRLELEVP